MLQASCMTLSKILILSVFSFQQYIIAINYQPHKHVARLNPFVSNHTTNLRNADCYDYYCYCHFGTDLSQTWVFSYEVRSYPNLKLGLKYQFPQKTSPFFSTGSWTFTLKGSWRVSIAMEKAKDGGCWTWALSRGRVRVRVRVWRERAESHCEWGCEGAARKH